MAVSVGVWSGSIDPEPLLLDYDAFQPLQWVTSNFLHAGLFHLVPNMIFLWVFGLIVEGKVGWLRFLGIFFGIGVVQCGLEQLLFSDAASLGASSIVFGLIGVSLVWSPLNDVTFFWFFWLILPRTGTFDVKVRTVAICYAAWELLWMGIAFQIAGFSPTSEFLHLMGAAIGVPIGVVMLRKRWVDCEGWDWFSVRRGDHKRSASLEALRHVRTPASRVGLSAEEDARRKLRRMREKIVGGDAVLAYGIYKGIPKELEEADLNSLADLLFRAKLWRPCSAVMKAYVQRFPNTSTSMRLRLAAIAIRHERRPAQGLTLLGTVRRGRLTRSGQALYDTLRSEAERLRAENPLELADDEAF